ncbi:MAG TPA: hypothetical protein DDY68_04030, partial [Porphyromonadaceae bacterium]|nr:hypothetical protein [Porphyromonadaceae bacterium]
MREKTEAIVLNSTKCTSNILLVKVFTKDRGILTLSTHIHIKKNKNTHIFNPLSILSIEMEYRENKEIMKLVSVEIAHSLITLETNPIV